MACATSDILLQLERNGWNTEPFQRPVQAAAHILSIPVASPTASVVVGTIADVSEVTCNPTTEPTISEIVAREAVLAYGRIRHLVRQTPLEPSSWLSGLADAGADCEDNWRAEPERHRSCQAFLKLESEQHTGSFKVRGALNKLLSLPPEVLSRGVFSASTGNHALAMIYACSAIASPPSTLASALSPNPAAPDPLHQLPTPLSSPAAAPTKDPEPSADHVAAAASVQRCSPGCGEASRADDRRGFSTEPCSLQLYVPETASPYKIRKLRALGGTVHLCGTDCLEAETAARTAAATVGAVFVSPYNDPLVMAGQGTVALELLAARRRGQLDVVLVPVGGGGLIGGMAAVLKAADPGIRVVGCQPAASDVMARSVLAGTIQPEADGGAAAANTLSDATAGGVEYDSVTLEPCMSCVDEWVVVEEREIAAALVGLLEEHSKLVEGAAACAISAFKRLAPRLSGLSVVVVACGGNIALTSLQRAMEMARTCAYAAGPANE